MMNLFSAIISHWPNKKNQSTPFHDAKLLIKFVNEYFYLLVDVSEVQHTVG